MKRLLIVLLLVIILLLAAFSSSVAIPPPLPCSQWAGWNGYWFTHELSSFRSTDNDILICRYSPLATPFVP